MRGFPKTIGSKQDMENLLAMPEHAEAARDKLAELAAARMVWVSTELVKGGKAGITDVSHRVVESEVEGKLVRQQMKIQEDPTAPFVRLGLETLQAEKTEIMEQGVRDVE